MKSKKGKRTAEKFLHDGIVMLEKLTEAQRSFHSDYQTYLAKEREKLLPEIQQSLWRVRTENINFEGGRIVESIFAGDPLNPAGSIIKPPGGRFNFGPISSFFTRFPGLYCASNYETAFAEKFQRRSNESEGDAFSGSEFSLCEPGSFSYNRVGVFMETVLDLRDSEKLVPFCEVIGKIHPSREIGGNWKKRFKTKKPLTTIKSVDQLVSSIFQSDYQQWPTWIDQPSNSQWLGLYAIKAGIDAIIFPSCRNESGYNVVVFPERIGKQSKTYVKLLDETPTVPKDRRIVDSRSAPGFVSNSFEMANALQPN